jgi:diguanylate cyclase (GGDEF)-like protein/PAS domain S-box-containing protein
VASSHPASHLALDELLRTGGVRSVFQPIVELDTGRVVAYEALARGPRGPLERPDQLFAAAREAGRLAELDQACRAAAFQGAVDHRLLSPLTLFVNVEPEVLDTAPLAELLRIAESAPGELRVVMEVTERALAARPSELLRTVERVRRLGWGIAVDDVGADPMSLSFMPLLRPDVVKLDLRLVQERPGAEVAQIMNAVNAYAESSGAVVLAEGIEDDAHLTMARALGATLGQGWLFGRPAAGASPDLRAGELHLPRRAAVDGEHDLSPFAWLGPGVPLRRAPKALLIELSKQLEREAMRLGETCVVAATFQEARHFTPATALRYRDLVERTGFVCALGEGLPAEPLPGVRGSTLAADDPVRGEWDVVVVSPHFSAALLARDLGSEGPDLERTFEYALTYDRETVVRAAHALLTRVTPLPRGARPGDRPVGARRPSPVGRSSIPAPRLADAVPPDSLLDRALAATPSGVAIVDLQLPDQPLVYVNSAFEALAGLPRDEVLGRNCRFLQGPDTDRGAVARIRAAIEAGTACRETLLNHRGPDRTPWWNEVHLAPITDAEGTVVQYVGVQVDVTARVEAERALVQERDRTRGYLARIKELERTDPLTGLPTLRRLEEQVEAAMWTARATGDALALLVVDLDGLRALVDRLGHSAGEDLLVETARRLRSRLRRTDLLGRLGGDEFVAVLAGLDAAAARAEAFRLRQELADAVGLPLLLAGEHVVVSAGVGTTVYPGDGEDVPALLRAAKAEMLERRAASSGLERR